MHETAWHRIAGRVCAARAAAAAFAALTAVAAFPPDTFAEAVPDSATTMKNERFPRRIDLSLSVEEPPAGIDAVRRPVGGGIPFPRGVLTDPRSVRLVRGDGSEVPFQIEFTAPWPDGSVRWLVITFLADLPGDLHENLVMEILDRPVPPRPPFPSDPPYEPDWTARLTLRDGDVATFVPKGKPWIEVDGPVHRVYRLEGEFRIGKDPTPFAALIRFHRYAGLPWTRIEHRFLVVGGDPMADFSRLRILLPGPGREKAPEDWSPGPGDRRRVQVTWREGVEGTPDEPLPREGALPGGVVIAGKNRRVVIAVRNFAQNWPKALIHDETACAVDLFPAFDPETYADRPEPVERLYYWLRDGVYRMRRGVRKTDEIFRGVFSSEDAPSLETVLWWIDHPPVVRASPEWVCSTGAAGPLIPLQPGRFPLYEKRMAASFDAMQARRESLQEYGALNFGDWYGERGRNWGNLEYDLAHGLQLSWLRGGDPRLLRRAEEAAWHQGDVDTVHADADPARIGAVWTHSLGHTGGYFPRGSFGMPDYFVSGIQDLGHVWCEGQFDLFLATGNRRFLEDGLLVADHLADVVSRDFHMRVERSAGWPILALLSAFETTGNEKYLEAARRIALVALERQDPQRGNWPCPVFECKHEPRHHGGKPFMAGILLSGFVKLHRICAEIDDDPAFRNRLAESIVKGCDWLLDDAWIPEAKAFCYADGCPTFREKPATFGAWMACEALAYAGELTGNPRYLDRAVESMRTAVDGKLPPLGKGVAGELQFSPRFLAVLGARGLDPFGPDAEASSP